ncbi:MAG: TetR/AcrR family transcriptional regulator [Lachnospiraceae bacterium]|nr:TetR/AcrR family transcriptional regulator [Lachnospiraceae bacterium]MBO4762081.1 TetR/AcrR family transcriptional regulator [Lachnospiraceae bacterium]MBQ6091549.1 TetR/AcrR family transcriptional regulator [Lachnospiraceae bacterium]MBR5367811.1 TetR/AcrR family transcriptional regulator [Lachnospiraceae bacterium]
MDRRRRDTKERFIKFTLERIRTSGEDDTTLRDLAKEFGISAAALYNHFVDKDELLNEVLKVASSKVTTLYREYLADHGTLKGGKERLIQFGEFLLELFKNESNLVSFLFFSKTAINLYSSVDVFENDQFKLLSIACEIIDSVRIENNLSISNFELYIKFWSFMEGYALFVTSGVFEGNSSFISDIVNDVLCGDAAKAKK